MKTEVDPITRATIDRLPDECPVCGKGIQAKSITADFTPESAHFMNLESVYQCPRSECKSFFLVYYQMSRILTGKKDLDVYKLRKMSPITYTGKSFPEEIIEISEKYTKIYNQAKQAEDTGLSEICGAGYRKALEFLVKDYIIYILYMDTTINDETRKESINKVKTKMFLQNCIKDYIEERSIRLIAEKATWLGNDEIHYYREWNDFELKDLKKLIHLTETFILLHLQKDDYLDKFKKSRENKGT